MKTTTHFKMVLILICCCLFNIMHAEQEYDITVNFQGHQRNYKYHLPTNYSVGSKVPVVFVFHGGSTRDAFRTRIQLDLIADKDTFITVYPQALKDADPQRSLWADTRGTRADSLEINDVAFTAFILDELIKAHSIDINKIYATGISAGGYFCQRLALQLSHRITAIACVASSLPTSLLPYFPPSRRVPVLFMNGTNDVTNPYDGGPAGSVGTTIPTETAVAYWASFNQCGASPTSVILPDINTSDFSSVTRITYNPCDDKSEVILYRVANGGHTWPGSLNNPATFGTTNLDINASNVIWSFFKKHKLNSIGPDLSDKVQWALSNYARNNNDANGLQTLYYNKSGHSNTANGLQALWNNLDGFDNTATGRASLFQNTLGSKNTATGRAALFSNTVGDNNTAIGRHTLFSNTTGENNTAIGANALYLNNRGSGLDQGNKGRFGLEVFRITGSRNTAIGASSLHSNVSGSDNTAVGYEALFNNETGIYNTAVGDQALNKNIKGDHNTAIGYNANTSADGFVNTTAIGANAIVTASNKIKIGDTSIKAIEGKVGFATISDGRFKDNIKEDVQGLDFILKLQPVSYNFNSIKYAKHIGEIRAQDNLKTMSDDVKERSVGFIAQEVEKIIEQTGFTSFDAVYMPAGDTDNYSIGYASFVVPLVKAVQELAAKNNALDDIIHRLKADNKGLAERLDKLELMLVLNSKLTSTLSESQ